MDWMIEETRAVLEAGKGTVKFVWIDGQEYTLRTMQDYLDWVMKSYWVMNQPGGDAEIWPPKTRDKQKEEVLSAEHGVLAPGLDAERGGPEGFNVPSLAKESPQRHGTAHTTPPSQPNLNRATATTEASSAEAGGHRPEEETPSQVMGDFFRSSGHRRL